MIAPAVGTFTDISLGTYGITDMVASVLAAGHCSFFNDKPADAKGMSTRRLYRTFGLAAYPGWGCVLFGRKGSRSYCRMIQIQSHLPPGKLLLGVVCNN